MNGDFGEEGSVFCLWLLLELWSATAASGSVSKSLISSLRF